MIDPPTGQPGTVAATPTPTRGATPSGSSAANPLGASSIPAAPGGIGTGVAVLWGLTSQLLTTIVLVILGKTTFSGVPIFLAIIGILIGAALTTYWGEMVRSGNRNAILFLIVFAILLFLGGLTRLAWAFNMARIGNFWVPYTEVILVIIAPIIVARMARPATFKWINATSPEAARARHGSTAWLATIIALAAVGGILQALAVLHS